MQTQLQLTTNPTLRGPGKDCMASVGFVFSGVVGMPTLAHKIRLDPTAKQEGAFVRACGVARFSFNWALARWNDLYQAGEKPCGAMLKREWNDLKREQFPWVYESPKNANDQPFADLDTAFRRFFKGLAKRPRFKKKGVHDAFYVANDKLRLDGKRVRLPVIGWVRMRETLRFEGRVLSARVNREADQWHLSVQVELAEDLPPSQGTGAVGVDVGLTHFATLSTGEKIDHPKALASNLKRLQRLSRQVSRKQRGSKNREKAKMKVARLHLRIGNIRRDFLHKLTTRLVRENQVIVAEKLHVRGMVRNRHLSRAISDSGWSEFRRQLVYKGELYGVEVILADRFYPSSKTCSGCGSVKDKLSLGERTYVCADCGLMMDRDENAARNLLALGLRVTACGGSGAGLDFGSGETAPAEAGTIPCSLASTR
jgi:putative transposase